ncbi:MAG: ATP-binding cassette domain-containing protein [Actinobacteria bacterium]|nr:ATP-binding cassette domain-containing protein [Actinomycetota bacterium]MBO0833483.1 ATP-binding cassette domain-containing protein [Actinomycetota bacterium]
MPARRAVMAADPVVAAGIGVRHGRGYALRAGSFRLTGHVPEQSVLGIHSSHPAQATAIIDLLAGVARPAYGELRVLGHDMATIRGRAAVRRRVGVARRTTRSLPWLRVRGLITHGARLARGGWADRTVLAAAIMDRMSLTPWADVPLASLPDGVASTARLAAAAVHQPELLLLDGLLDGLGPREMHALTSAIRDLGQDSAVVVAGVDSDPLMRACDDVLVLTDGVLIPGGI